MRPVGAREKVRPERTFVIKMVSRRTGMACRPKHSRELKRSPKSSMAINGPKSRFTTTMTWMLSATREANQKVRAMSRSSWYMMRRPMNRQRM